MRKLKQLCALVLAVCLIAGVCPALAAGSITADCNDATRVVKIQCTIPSGLSDRNILQFVIKPDQEAAFDAITNPADINETILARVDQTATGRGGSFIFTFTMDENARGGTYTVRVSTGENSYLSDDFYFVGKDLIEDALTAVNGAADGSALMEVITKTFVKEIKADLTNADYVALKRKADVFTLMKTNHPGSYTDLDAVRAEFLKAVADQKYVEYKEQIVSEIATAEAGNIGELLTQYNEELQLPLDNNEDFTVDTDDAVYKLMADMPFTTIKDVQDGFYKAVCVANINIVPSGFIVRMGVILNKYKNYIVWPEAYNNCSQKGEVHKRMIGRQYTSVENIAAVMQEVATQVNSSINTGGQTPGGSTGGTGSTGGGPGSSVTVPSTPKPTPTTDPNPVDPTPPPTEGKFTDVPAEHWAANSINTLVEMGILNGISETEFAPDANVTREQFIAMLVNAFDMLDEEAACEFTDVDSSAWYYPYIASAYEARVTLGREDGSYGVGEQIKREDMAMLAYRIMEYQELTLSEVEEKQDFADEASISDYAKDAITAMQRADVLNGTEGNNFAPAAFATRAQAAQVIYKLVQFK